MRLPQVAKRPQRAERPSMAAVRPTDLGLGVAAQETHAWQEEVRRTQDVELEVQREADWRAVEPELKGLQDRFEARFAEAGAQWDGIEPGFARRIGTALDSEIAPMLARDDLSPGQKDALSRGLSQYREATGQRAIQYQAQRRGQQAAEAQAAREAVAVGSVMAGYVEAFGSRKTQRDNDYDGSTPDYVEGVLSDHDAVAEGLIAAAPEALRPRVTQQLAARRLQLQGQAMDFEARAEQGFLAGQVRAAGSQLVNGVLSSPTMYETAVAEVDQTLAALPRAARGEARAGLLNDLTEAYVSGLVQAGQHDQALSLLNGGSLDGRLRPATKQTLLRQATSASERLDVDDWLARMSLEQSIDDDLASRVATGQGLDGLDPAEIATVLGPQAAARYLMGLDAAASAHESLTGLSQMTGGQIAAHVESLKPVPGSAGYEMAERAYQAAQTAARAEMQARESDPAAWAVAQSPRLREWLDGLGSPDPAARARAARAYGANVMAMQDAAGIDPAARRILTKPMAEAMLDRARSNPDRTAGLRGLGMLIEAYGPRAGASAEEAEAGVARRWRVLKELGEADPQAGADLAAAVTFAGSNVAMGRYIAARDGGALLALKPSDQASLRGAVEAEMRPYLNSFRVGPSSATLRQGQVEAVATMAAAAGGGREAVRQAAGLVTAGYDFVGPSNLRVPRGALQGGFRLDGGSTGGDIERGTRAVLRRLTEPSSTALRVPDAPEWRQLSPELRRERFNDAVRLNARWMTTPDDQRAILMRPTLEGRWTPVAAADGGTITMTWTEAQRGSWTPRPATASAPASAPREPARRPGTQGAAPRGVRNNNPGNLRPTGDRWQGMRGIDRSGAEGANGGFVVFETPVHGARAMARDLTTKYGRGLDTVEKIIRVWAPRNENNTGAYVRAVSRALGVQSGARLNLRDPARLAGLMKAMADHENGPGHFTLGQMMQGVHAAGVGR